MREPRPVAPGAMHAEPNVTPFLDVLLVLLIIFMYLSLNQQKIITAQLPDPTPVMGPNTPSIMLEVRPGPHYAINTQLVSAPQLAGRLRDLRETYGEDAHCAGYTGSAIPGGRRGNRHREGGGRGGDWVEVAGTGDWRLATGNRDQGVRPLDPLGTSNSILMTSRPGRARCANSSSS